ncbi:DUF805 domain-containing protein [Macrococcus hajekii]|uniref:DUF805 domain-containing protein n=1 Tax=Macrococcus hajekii TaxID=198482 RepID=A0A4R6BLG0_9STAP|nr:DUF805 domain-containing protein [Macrococcus hajekii]TDM02619.1 DUF805 domain-containing protein [Macrococcus hajekii]GGB02531.1 hypothetical protein GCM10007190_08110 [Macrococcus hajekii]
MTFMEAYKRYWKKAFVMRGRARRKEYWVPQLFNLIIALILMLIFSFVDRAMGYSIDTMASDQLTASAFTKPSDIANWIWSLIILIPSFTVLARRLQDININGWWALVSYIGGTVIGIGMIFALVMMMASGASDFASIGLIFFGGLALLLIMAIVFFVFTVMDSKPGPNKYGEDPKRNERYYYNDTYEGNE